MAQRKKDKIRDNILKKSLTLFRNKGYNETSIKDIAQACDISVGNIYKYYKSKSEIYENIITDEFLEELHDILSKRTIFLAKRQLNEHNEKIEKWFEKEYYPFMINNADRCVVLHDHYVGSEYDKRVNDIANNILEFKRKVYLNLGNLVLPKEFLTLSSLIIASNVTMYAQVLEMNVTDKKKIQLLKEIDKYNIAGLDAIFKEIIKWNFKF